MAETIPQSRIEDILDGVPVPKPQSRIEQLLLDGGGGVPDNVYTKGEVNSLLSYKVNKVNGKQLSTEDYTTDEKTKLAELTKDYTNLDNKPQINGVTLSGDESSADLGLLPASTRYGGSISTRNYFDPVTGDMLTDINLKDQNGSDMSTITFDQPVVHVGCDSSGLLVTYPSARASIDLSPAMSRKVDKIQGKGLSTEDFTAMYKAWLGVSMQSPLNHNGIFRGKDLTDVYTIEQMYSMIHAGTFDDLFLGDYFTKSITTDIMTRFTGEAFDGGTTYYEMGGGTDVTARTWAETEDSEPQSEKTYATKQTKTENVTLMFGGFNYYYNMGDTALATPHAILIPRNAGFATAAKMNLTNTTAGGYYGSDMHQITLPCYAKSLKTALNNHVLSHRTLLSNAINSSTTSMAGSGMTGAASGWEWTTVELQLMNEVQVYGTKAWTSSAYDVGIDYRKLPVFDFINPVQFVRGAFWIRSVVSSVHFAFCYGDGAASYSGASSTNYVRPLIVFG